ncbi:MAG: hypothetical protein XD52_0873, partial [bacterium 42_11]
PAARVPSGGGRRIADFLFGREFKGRGPAEKAKGAPPLLFLLSIILGRDRNEVCN